MQIISGSSSHIIAKKIAQNTGFELLITKISNFKDGELKVEIQGNIRDEVIIIQSTSPPVNNNLMELLLIADTLKRAGAKNIIAVIPYFGYSRQDYCNYKHGPISASLVIKLLEAAGITKIITLDLHSKQLEGIFNIPIINLAPTCLFHSIYNEDENIVIVSPDIGGIFRARNFSSMLNKDLVIINKVRDTHNECFMNKIIGVVKNKKCIIIDDIVDSGDTLCKAVNLLSEKGAKSTEAYITHPVLSGDAIDNIISSSVHKVFVSNSIYHSRLPDKFVTLAVEELISKILLQ